MPDDYLRFVDVLKDWIAQGLFAEVAYDTMALSELEYGANSVPDRLLQAFSAQNTLACTRCWSLYQLSITWERPPAEWAPLDSTMLRPEHPARRALPADVEREIVLTQRHRGYSWTRSTGDASAGT